MGIDFYSAIDFYTPEMKEWEDPINFSTNEWRSRAWRTVLGVGDETGLPAEYENQFPLKGLPNDISFTAKLYYTETMEILYDRVLHNRSVANLPQLEFRDVHDVSWLSLTEFEQAVKTLTQVFPDRLHEQQMALLAAQIRAMRSLESSGFITRYIYWCET